jgi:hypothetical protein
MSITKNITACIKPLVFNRENIALGINRYVIKQIPVYHSEKDHVVLWTAVKHSLNPNYDANLNKDLGLFETKQEAVAACQKEHRSDFLKLLNEDGKSLFKQNITFY